MDRLDVVKQFVLANVDDIAADTLAHLKYQRTGCELKFIRLLINIDLREYSILSLEDSDIGYHSTEFEEMLTKCRCTNLSYIPDFQLINFVPGWEDTAALSFLTWIQE
ncbi:MULTISPECIES: hypothetical protein [Shewanella]|uniref:hypothetical protein n=1 Tax=Shewanella TaxID=22 RepID=UPI000849A842|nr:hypothetical protein [Shewanella xiamenensis]MCT8865458.1 hypothetical protein [Shewanella xiamenensis]MCT8878324.1 hypothetical protein [Shewanella xiamenensis]ODR83608.1 hypothetical protein ABT47_22750 [Shewanella xiamenensis]BDQ68401.1 hypothetical protein NUITMVS2_42140 [Shewanella xiamenensis]GLD78126.1 hypothetical protein NUITMVS3_25580 [Shewanella xiamenensis]